MFRPSETITRSQPDTSHYQSICFCRTICDPPLFAFACGGSTVDLWGYRSVKTDIDPALQNYLRMLNSCGDSVSAAVETKSTETQWELQRITRNRGFSDIVSSLDFAYCTNPKHTSISTNFQCN